MFWFSPAAPRKHVFFEPSKGDLRMKNLSALAGNFLLLVGIGLATAPAALGAYEKTSVQPSLPTADHSKFEALKKEFKSGPEVTEACLTCHNQAGHQIRNTIHWTWELDDNGQKNLGKSKFINNF
jgi:hypothetical protein